jgi:hypothetical protein
MTTLVIDTGQDILGIYSVEDREYVAYRGNRIAEGVERARLADEVITYNGERRDLLDLARFARLDGDFPLKGKHTDMQIMCWAPIFGSSLTRTFNSQLPVCPEFPFGRTNSELSDDYEDSNQRDVYMTLKLWELWKDGKLNLPGDGYLHR